MAFLERSGKCGKRKAAKNSCFFFFRVRCATKKGQWQGYPYRFYPGDNKGVRTPDVITLSGISFGGDNALSKRF
jgi:hypothetical protein